MTNIVQASNPQGMLDHFVDLRTASDMLARSKSTVCDMVDRGLLTRYRVGTSVLFLRSEVLEVSCALRRLEVR